MNVKHSCPKIIKVRIFKEVLTVITVSCCSRDLTKTVSSLEEVKVTQGIVIYVCYISKAVS